MVESSEMVLDHVWEEAGLGKAPFRFVAVIKFPSQDVLAGNVNAYNSAAREAQHEAKAFGVHLCSCYYCGNGLLNNAVIRDANGKRFVVGLDCVRKTDDAKLISAADKADKEHKKALRAARAKKRREEREAKWEAEREEERKRNGGLTDREVAKEAARVEREEKEAVVAAANDWAIRVLEDANRSDFVDSILRDLRSRPIAEFSPRCLDILADIYAKTVTDGARRGSKKFDAAYEEFCEKSGMYEEDSP